MCAKSTNAYQQQDVKIKSAAVSLVPLPSLRFEFPVIAALSAERLRQPSVHSQMRDSAGIQAAARIRSPACLRFGGTFQCSGRALDDNAGL